MKNNESVFLRISYKTIEQDNLINQIEALGFREDLLLQQSDMTFLPDKADPERSVFSLVIDAAEKDRIATSGVHCQVSASMTAGKASLRSPRKEIGCENKPARSATPLTQPPAGFSMSFHAIPTITGGVITGRRISVRSHRPPRTVTSRR